MLPTNLKITVIKVFAPLSNLVCAVLLKIKPEYSMMLFLRMPIDLQLLTWLLVMEHGQVLAVLSTL